MILTANKDGRTFKSICRFLAWLVFSFTMLASAASAQVIDIETFGSGSYPGPALQGNQTTYTYNAPAQPANFPNILMDGQYVIATNTQQGFANWASIGDNTTGSGYMMLINADDNQSGEFYRAQIPLTANTSFDFVTYLVTANSQGDFDFCTANEGGLVLPDVTMQIEDGSGGIIATLDTGPIPFNPTPEWGEYQITFATDAVTTSVELVLINNSVGGCGNDLAIDDITFQVAVTMEAFDDSVTLTNTDVAQSAVLTLGANDNLDGNPLPGTELYFTAAGSSLPSGISLNGSTGEVGVAAGTPEGTYTFDYEVCETSNKYNCSIATATIIVAFPMLPVAAADDTGSVADSSFGDTSVLNVLGNDSIDNVTSPTDFDLSISAGSSLPSALTFDVSTGEVGVLPGAPTGLYSFDYDICEAGDPTNCETATVTIDVTNPNSGGFCPAGTSAIPGTYHVVSATGGQNANLAVGQPVAEGTTLTNSAVTFFGPITMDLTGDPEILAAEGEVIEVVLSSHFGTQGRAEILMSADGVNYTSLGTAGNGGSVYGAWASNIMRYDDFVVPAGGARFLQVSHQNSGVRVDGAIYGTQCQAVAPTDVDLVTVKSLSSANATPNEGDTVTFVIEVSNNGVGEATGVSLTDLIPAGLTATGVNGTVSSGSYDAGTGLWALGTLADGASATLTIEGIVDAGQGGNAITNTLAAPASGDQTDPTTVGDDLTETITVTVVSGIEAVDNDFTAAPIAPGLGSVTASIFGNDTLNGAAFTPTDVSATITDDGSLFGATINPDGTIDIPATIAPGIYQLVYEICDINDPSVCDTATVMIAVQAAAANAHTNPDVCGAFLSQGWITHGKLNLHDTEVRFRSGDFATDPYLYLPIERDAEGRIITYFGPSDGTHSGTLTTFATLPLVSTRNSDSDHESEMHVIVYRLEGAPGSTLTADLNTRAAQEHSAYWIEDTAGNVISASDFEFTTGTPNIGGIGEVLPLSFTVPADGIAYLNTAIFDPSQAYGRPIVSNYQCPAPSLSMTKVADNPGPYTAGDVVTYTYTVLNDGDQIVRDIAIADTHNGSDPAPVPGNETLLTDAAPTGDSTDAGTNNSWDVLAPGDTVVFTGTYIITAIDAANL